MILPSPLGPLTLTATDAGLTSLRFGEIQHPEAAGPARQILRRAAGQLEEYWAGRRISFDLPVAAPLTPVQRAIASAIPLDPLTYGELAVLIGRPNAARAVGRALSTNPLPIIIACHRVLPAAGGIGHYLGGTERKRWLLDHECAMRGGVTAGRD
ncbi:MAG: methylated-DNA--[protein]-cysteine S-methyltransferase [Flaviflexus sp.]|nr:methylated-DNA--[protein]-cysteine S-methyltransferase [Flaviflexus sp.]